MIISILKYYSIFLGSSVVFIKSINLKDIKAWKWMFLGVLALFEAALVVALNDFNPLPVRIPLLIALVLTVLIMKILMKTDTRQTIIASIISFGVSYPIFIFSAFFITVGYTLLFHKEMALNPAASVLLLILQLTISFLLFRVKRIKKGIPYLLESNIPYLDIFICSLIVLFFMLLSGVILPAYIAIPIILSIILFSIVLFFLWKSKIRRLYLQRQKARELEILYATLKENKHLIQKLHHDNQELSKIIHKDNKLIPSIENAVLNLTNRPNPEDIQNKEAIESIHQQLAFLKIDRLQAIRDYRSEVNPLPGTGSFLIDSMNDYMAHRAQQNEVQYDFSTSVELKSIYDNNIDEREFCTLFSDLIENALIAVSTAVQKRVSISIEKVTGYPAIIVRDSGAAFEAEVLCLLGRERITTHAHEGGSGIGLMSLFELLHKSKASLVIHEYQPEGGIFTKFVMVVFDHSHEYRIESPRAGALRNFCNRDEIIYAELVKESSE